MEKTAIEWLATQLPRGLVDGFKDAFEQAKQIEKGQIIQAWENGALPDLIKEYKNSRTYYNETYGK